MERDIVKYFKQYGKSKSLTVIDPFVINDPNKIWYIDKGKINLSSVKYVDNEPIGKLYNFYNFNQGEIFFGIKQKDNESLVFLADAEEDSLLYEISIDLVKKEINQNKNLTNEFSILVDNWIKNLYEAINDDTTIRKPPVIFLLSGNERTIIEDDTFISTNHSLTWFKTNEIDNFLFNGHISIKANGQIYFPISKKAFLKVKSTVELDLFKTDQIINTNEFWKGLGLLHELTLESDLFEAQQYQVNSENWLKQKIKTRNEEFSQTLNFASSILKSSKKSKIKAKSEHTKNNYFNVCSLVAEQSDIKAVLPPGLHNSENPIDDICRYSGIRYREVILEGEWYKNTGEGALLGFLKESNLPIAIISNGKNRFEAIDLKNDSSFEIDKESYRRIEKISYIFYKSLPRKKLKFADLLKFSITKNKSDIFRLINTGVLTTILALVVPIMTAVLFDDIIPNAQRNQLPYITYALLMAAVGGIFFEVAKNISILRPKNVFSCISIQ